MSESNQASPQASEDLVKVWDPFVRVFHWTLAIGFFIAYFSEDVLLLHVWTGYLLGALILLRILWGFIGPKHARFRDFLFPPPVIATYLFDLVRFKSMRYLGHSPAGAAMIFVLLGGTLAVIGTGLVLYAVEDNAGPLASWVHADTGAGNHGLPLMSSARADEREEHEEFGEHRDGTFGTARAGEHDEEGEGFWEEAHEVLANLVLFLALVHIAGVLLASAATRENLSRSMVTGLKRRH